MSNFFIAFVNNEIFKTLFTKRKLIRYYYFINVYIVYQNRNFILMNSVSPNSISFFSISIYGFNFFFWSKYIDSKHPYILSQNFLSQYFKRVFIIKSFFSFYSILFYTQQAFFHLLRDFCNFHVHIFHFLFFLL